MLDINKKIKIIAILLQVHIPLLLLDMFIIVSFVSRKQSTIGSLYKLHTIRLIFVEYTIWSDRILFKYVKNLSIGMTCDKFVICDLHIGHDIFNLFCK